MTRTAANGKREAVNVGGLAGTTEGPAGGGAEKVRPPAE